MSEIMGTVTTIKRYLSPDKIELTVSPDKGGNSTIILEHNRKYIIPDFQREIRWDANNLSILLSDLSTRSRFLGNIILTIQPNGDCQIIDGQQRTTILLLIIAYISNRYKERVECFPTCSIENRSFSGLTRLLSSGFETSVLEDPEVINSDIYGQCKSFQKLWNWLDEVDSFSSRHSARKILENIAQSKVNIIASHEDDSNSSIRYFLDVNLKGVQLDTEDIFKAQVFSLSTSDEMLQLWRKNKANMLKFNQSKGDGGSEKNTKDKYPLMKLYEHYFYCDLFKSYRELEVQNLQFGEDFSITSSAQYEGERFYKGTHLLEVINDVSYVKSSLSRLNIAISIMNDIVSSCGPSDQFKSLFVCSKKIDSNQIILTYDFLQRILLDKEVVPKVLVLKYIMEYFDGKEHDKQEYNLIYSVFAAASLFILFSRKKNGAQLYKIVQSAQWGKELNRWIDSFIGSVELTKSRMMAVYRFVDDETDGDDTFQYIRCKALAMLHNYFVFKKTSSGDWCVGITNCDQLLNYVTNKTAYTIEHFIFPKTGSLHIKTSNLDFQYPLPSQLRKYKDILFNYLFLPKDINQLLGNLPVAQKAELLNHHKPDITCNYSRNYLDVLSQSSLLSTFPHLEDFSTQQDLHDALDNYFEEIFPEKFYQFAQELLARTELIPRC